jgi:hypothetical protein
MSGNLPSDLPAAVFQIPETGQNVCMGYVGRTATSGSFVLVDGRTIDVSRYRGPCNVLASGSLGNQSGLTSQLQQMKVNTKGTGHSVSTHTASTFSVKPHTIAAKQNLAGALFSP